GGGDGRGGERDAGAARGERADRPAGRRDGAGRGDWPLRGEPAAGGVLRGCSPPPGRGRVQPRRHAQAVRGLLPETRDVVVRTGRHLARSRKEKTKEEKTEPHDEHT